MPVISPLRINDLACSVSDNRSSFARSILEEKIGNLALKVKANSYYENIGFLTDDWNHMIFFIDTIFKQVHNH